jgi:Fe-S oxidoreductase
MSRELLSNNFQTLDEIRWSSEKCVRCNMCKFPPLARVESQAHSIGCPSYEAFKFNANSGGGMLIMANSLMAGRSRVTETVRDIVYGCTLCGLCDVSCKFNTDIEVLETLFLLRHRLFEEDAIRDEHRAVLACIRQHGHPLIELAGSRSRVTARSNRGRAGTLVWVGPHFARDSGLAGWLEQMLDLLDRGGLRYQLLGDQEPYTGRAALEIGDRDLFRAQSLSVAKAIRESGAKNVLCLSAEDYSTLRSQTPKFAELDVPVRHISETYAALIKRRKLAPRGRLTEAGVAWHDPCYLGRLGGRYVPWRGTQEKIGGIKVYAPRRPIDYGSGGVFEAPRRVLAALCEEPLREFERRKEYAFNAGESGQAAAAMPEFAAETAQRRIQEAVDCGIRTVVTECPQAHAALTAAAQLRDDVRVRSLTEIFAQSQEGSRS